MTQLRRMRKPSRGWSPYTPSWGVTAEAEYANAQKVTQADQLPKAKCNKDVTKKGWNCEDVQVPEMFHQDYIAVNKKHDKYLPRSAVRYAAKKFCKDQCPIVKGLVNSLMVHERNNVKKIMTANTSLKHRQENMINCTELILLLASEVNSDKMMKRLWKKSFFNPKTKKWSCKDVQSHNVFLKDYIAMKEEYVKYLPHSAGRCAAKRFNKAQCPIA